MKRRYDFWNTKKKRMNDGLAAMIDGHVINEND